MSELPPKFDADAACAKCGCLDVSTQYRTMHGSGHLMSADRLRILGLTEWLSRQCARCKYVWDELPLDTVIVE